MNTFSQNQIYYTASCGLPTKFLMQKIVLGYAEGSYSLNEYTEYYNRMTPSQKEIADDLIMEIHALQSQDSLVFAEGK